MYCSTGTEICRDLSEAGVCPTSSNRCLAGTAEEYKIKCDNNCECKAFTLINRCADHCCQIANEGNKDYKCKKGKCVLTGDCEEECVDISKCVGNFNVVTSGLTICPDGLVCVERESCKIASTVPQLPTTPTNSINVQEPTSSSNGSTVNLSNKPLSEILEDLIKWLLKIVILIAILMIIVSGAMYMISAGDQQKVDTAKKALTYAILGLLVVVLAYAIVDTLVGILT
jgi:hypothetical protein